MSADHVLIKKQEEHIISRYLKWMYTRGMRMTDRDEVLSVLNREVIGLKDRFGIKRIGLFGSVVRNEATHTSDLDILIEFDPATITYRKYLDLEEFLQS